MREYENLDMWIDEARFAGISVDDFKYFKFITQAKTLEYVRGYPLTLLTLVNLCYYIDEINTTPKNKARLIKNAVELIGGGFSVEALYGVLRRNIKSKDIYKILRGA